jgi:uncharacterized membrane protein
LVKSIGTNELPPAAPAAPVSMVTCRLAGPQLATAAPAEERAPADGCEFADPQAPRASASAAAAAQPTADLRTSRKPAGVTGNLLGVIGRASCSRLQIRDLSNSTTRPR